MSLSSTFRRLPVTVFGIGLLGLSTAGLAQTNVLFVGNSFTFGNTSQNDPVTGSATTVAYYNNANVTDEDGTNYGGMPGIFKAFTTAANLSYNVSIEAVSGQTLQYHQDNKSSIVGQSKWSTVVLQDLSTILLPDAKGGDRYGNHAPSFDLQKLVQTANPNAKLLLYQTWAYPAALSDAGYTTDTSGLKSMQSDLSFGTADTFKKYGFDSDVRVGDAFQSLLDAGTANYGNTGAIKLYKSDSYHAGVNGMFLSAAMMYQKITGNDPRTLPTNQWSALSINSTVASQLFDTAYSINALGNPTVTVPLPMRSINAGTNFNSSTRVISGASNLTSITTQEGTFTNLIGANNLSTAAGASVLYTTGASTTANNAIQGLSLHDGISNLSTGKFQFTSSPFTSDSRFFIIDSDLASQRVGDAATVQLIDSAGNIIGSYKLNLVASDFTASIANSTSDAIALIKYASGQSSSTTQWKEGAVSFSLADLGISDASTVAAATGLYINGNNALDVNVVGTYSVPEPGGQAIALLLVAIASRRGRRIFGSASSRNEA